MLTRNDGVEKPNSEPGIRDLGSYFCSHRLSCLGTGFVFDLIHGGLIAACERFVRRGAGRLDVFHAVIPSVSELHSHDARVSQCCASGNTASIARPLCFFRAA